MRFLRISFGYWIFPQNEHARLHWNSGSSSTSSGNLSFRLHALLREVARDGDALAQRNAHAFTHAGASRHRAKYARGAVGLRRSAHSSSAVLARRRSRSARMPAAACAGRRGRASGFLDDDADDGERSPVRGLARARPTPCRRRATPSRRAALVRAHDAIRREDRPLVDAQAARGAGARRAARPERRAAAHRRAAARSRRRRRRREAGRRPRRRLRRRRPHARRPRGLVRPRRARARAHSGADDRPAGPAREQQPPRRAAARRRAARQAPSPPSRRPSAITGKTCR